jgi:hypothetical protein
MLSCDLLRSFKWAFSKREGRESVDGIVTGYGLDGPGIESWARDFPNLSILALEPTQPLYGGYRRCFPGVKRPDRGVGHPPPSSAEVKERLEVDHYFPSWPSGPVFR